MPTTVTSTSNYVGKAAGDIIGASFKEADTINKGLLTVMQNVNYQVSLRKIAYENGKQAYSCGFTPAGAVTLTEKTIAPVKVKNDLQVCKEDFRNTWSDDMMGGSAKNPMLAGDIREAILAEKLASTAEDTDSVIWTGNNSSDPKECNGFITQFAADSGIIKANNGITAVNDTVDKDNVLTIFDTATAAIPVTIRKKPLIMAVSPDVADAYYKKLIDSGVANGLGGDANTLPKYGRYTPMEVAGLPDNTIVIYEKKNLVFATGLLGDHNEVSAIDEDEIGLLTGMVRTKMVYNYGVGYYNPEEIVWLLTTTS